MDTLFRVSIGLGGCDVERLVFGGMGGEVSDVIHFTHRASLELSHESRQRSVPLAQLGTLPVEEVTELDDECQIVSMIPVVHCTLQAIIAKTF